MMKFLLKMCGIALVSVNLALLAGCGGGAAASVADAGAGAAQGVALPSKVSVVK